ncbi:MAG: glycosyltransferase, partial [Candidatus Helarchaeota archaeon]
MNGVTGESKLTFLMPTYNDEKYIEESIKSIVHQTFTNWELLIMDKSSDKTINIINSYVSKYPNKIKYYKQEDTGQLNALLG